MALRRIPGSRNYKADDTGFKQILNSSKMSAASVDVAHEIAGNAMQEGRGAYTVSATPVRAGWANETRAGATVSALPNNDWRDTRDRVLLRVLDSMAIRSGPLDPGREMVTYTRKDGTTRKATRAQADAWMRQRGGR